MQTPNEIPDPVLLHVGGAPKRYEVQLKTELRQEVADLRSAKNFVVNASLKTPTGATVEKDAFRVTAAADDKQHILVQLCLDPAPRSGTLEDGKYRAAVDFFDPRIPETTLRFDVWVGAGTPFAYGVMVVIVGVLLLAALPAAIAFAALLDEDRKVKAELRAAVPWLGLLLGVGALGYLWAVWFFRETNDFYLWSFSSEGVREFLGFTIGKVTIALTAPIALLAAIPKWREHAGKLLASDPTAKQLRLFPRRRLRMPRRVILGFGLALLVLAVASLGLVIWNQSGEPNRSGPPPTVAPTVVPPGDVLGGLVSGTTPGEEAVAKLRAAGFVVYDYRVCSNSFRDPDVLRQVKETRTGAVLVDKMGEPTASTKPAPPAALDVLITSGDPCTR